MLDMYPTSFNENIKRGENPVGKNTSKTTKTRKHNHPFEDPQVPTGKFGPVRHTMVTAYLEGNWDVPQVDDH